MTPGLEADEIQQLIDAFAELTLDGPGVTRLAYTDLERQAHRMFADRMTDLGAKVTVDTAGNTIAELPVDDATIAAIGTGSHLDSVPHGGRFDGIAGVCVGMAVFSAVTRQELPRSRPWRLVAFAGEEGARFGQACTGSRAVAGLLVPGQLDDLHDEDGVTLAAAMQSVNLDPGRLLESRWQPDDWAGFVELHIEQGNALEESGTPIGVVDAISGSSRLRVVLEGTASHTGGTPMHLRRDALTAAAEMVLACEDLATAAPNHGTRITVGRMSVLPGSVTTIPGNVDFTVDVRDFDSARQRDVADDLCDLIGAIAARRGIQSGIEIIGDTSPVLLSSRITDVIVAAAQDIGAPYRLMPSGASHDSQQISRVTPTGMIFVPSRDGLSHVPDEWTSPTDLALGAEVLLAALQRLDSAA